VEGDADMTGFAVFCTDCQARASAANTKNAMKDSVSMLKGDQHRFLCADWTAKYPSRGAAQQHLSSTTPPRPPEFVA
jgi:hypothetical protein